MAKPTPDHRDVLQRIVAERYPSRSDFLRKWIDQALRVDRPMRGDGPGNRSLLPQDRALLDVTWVAGYLIIVKVGKERQADHRRGSHSFVVGDHLVGQG